MRTKLLLLSFLLSISFTRAQIYVDANAQGNNDGTSWTDAYVDLQTAIGSATLTKNEIWIAAGTYSPGSNRSDSFTFSINRLSVYGGFAGTETSITERDIKANPTILSGDVNGNDNGIVDFPNVPAASVRFDNNHQVTKISGHNVTLDGLRIEDGDAIHAANGYIQGAAIYVESTAVHPTIQNCEINNNVTYAGGAIRIDNTVYSNVKITNCIFNNNLGLYASGLYLVSRANTTINVNLTNNLFINNVTKDYTTGGIRAYSGSSVWIRTFELNSVITSKVTNCTFANNSDLGTINSVEDRSTLSLSQNSGIHNATVSNCIFYDNVEQSGVKSPAIGNADSPWPSQYHVYNSIAEGGFSNIDSSFLTNTSNENPLFANATFVNVNTIGTNVTVTPDDFELRSNSPAIDTGDSSKVPADVTTDLLLNNRIFHSDVDMGAYEFTGVIALGKTYVNANVSGGNGSGDSWENAKSDLQEAINNSGPNHEIWVAAGTYNPGSNRANTFNFSFNNVFIYGGFIGTETSIAERDIKANPTILSGDVKGNDNGIVDFPNIGAASVRLDNNHRVSTISADDITIDGFKIEDGDAAHATNNFISGSAINILPEAISPTIQNCEINNNVTYSGGAIDVRNTLDSNVTIANCIFNNNLGAYASSIHILPRVNTITEINLVNNLFLNNSTKNYSSAYQGFTGSAAWIRANNAGAVITSNIINCTFVNNHDFGTLSSIAERGPLGLTKVSGTHNATISNSIFYGNTGLNIGAGLPVALAISNGNDHSADLVNVSNSIDEDGFSNIASSNRFNTTNSDPLFANDFTLQSGSPAINAGDNSKIPTGITTDLLLNNRIHNATVDMGAYEFGSSPLLSNTNIDSSIVVNEVSIYPNPATSLLNVKTKDSIKNIEVFNLQGAKVLESKSNSTMINVSKLTTGVYIIKVELSNGSYLIKRFIKK